MTMTEEKYSLAVDAYSDMVFKIAYQNLFHREDAEDVVQDVFLKLLKQKKNKFRDDEHMKSWLIRVTINQCLDMKKKNSRRNTVPLEEWQAAYEPEEREVLMVLRELSEDDRNILYLYYYEQYTIKEISKILGKKQNTVNSRLTRARTKLKKILEGDV